MNSNIIQLELGFDKIVLTVSPPKNSAEYGKGYVQYLKAECLDKINAKFASHSAQNGYRVALRMLHPAWKSEAAPLLQASPYDPNKPYFRLEFNPNLLGTAGIAALKDWIDEHTPHGWPLFLKSARVSRIDANIDAGGLPLERVFARARCARTCEVWSRKGDIESIEYGEPQTLYHGQKAKSKKLYRIYGLNDPTKVPKGCTTATRFEAVDRKSHPPLTDLHKIKSPFTDLIVHSALAAKPATWPEGNWRMFLRVAGDHGLPVARMMLTPAQRKQADAALAAAPIAGLDFKETWEAWPLLITWLGLQKPGSNGGFMPGYASEHIDA